MEKPPGAVVARPKPAPVGHTRSEPTEEFLRGVSTLKEGFEAGYRFLTELANDHFGDFRLGTYSNAHLYYSRDKSDRNDFYAYIKPSKHAIELISRPNGRPWAEADNKSGLLFGPRLTELVTELDGFKDGWARSRPLGITLSNQTPPIFFERLLEKIREVHK